MLLSGWSHGVGSREVCPLQVRGSEVGDTLPDGRAELCDRLLNGSGVVVCLSFIDLGDPAKITCIRIYAMNGYTSDVLEQ